MGFINYSVKKTLENRIRGTTTTKIHLTKSYQKFYGKYKGKVRSIGNTSIYLIYGCAYKAPMNFNQEICNYTIKGRKLIHDRIKGYNHLIEYLLMSTNESMSSEYCDNRISKLIGQQGKCGVTARKLKIGNMECHHKVTRELGGTDEYSNLMWIDKRIHKLIHATNSTTINKYIREILTDIELTPKGYKVVNTLRKLVGNSVI